jgi:hypothetical protein
MRRQNEMAHSAQSGLTKAPLVRFNIGRADNRLLRHTPCLLPKKRNMTGWQLSNARCTDESILC